MKTFGLIVFILLGSALLLGGIFIGVFRAMERSVLYHPTHDCPETPADYRLRAQDITFLAADGTQLRGWWIPAYVPRATVVYCRGNSGNMSYDATWAPFFNKHRFNLLLWDYRGYGQSEGRPSEKGLRMDAQAAFDVASTLSKDLPILLYGHSLGGAVAARLACDRPAAALILDSTFSSAADMARRLYPSLPLEHLISARYNAAQCVASLPDIPKIFGHDPEDAVVPFQSGRLLHAASRPPNSFVLLSGGHTAHSWLISGGRGNAELERFLAPWTLSRSAFD